MLFPRSDTCQEASGSGLWPGIRVSVKAAKGSGGACPGAEAGGGFLGTSLSTCGQHPGPQGWQCRVASGPHWPTKDKLTTARETPGDTPEYAPPWEVQSTEQTSWERPLQAPAAQSAPSILFGLAGTWYGPRLQARPPHPQAPQEEEVLAHVDGPSEHTAWESSHDSFKNTRVIRCFSWAALSAGSTQRLHAPGNGRPTRCLGDRTRNLRGEVTVQSQNPLRRGQTVLIARLDSPPRRVNSGFVRLSDGPPC